MPTMFEPWTEWGEVCGAGLVAQRLMFEDPELSNILALQTAWLRTGQPEALEFALAPVRAVREGEDRARSELWLGDVFVQPLTTMRGPQGNVAWLHDHGPGGAAQAQDALRELLAGPRRPGLRQLRLLLEDTPSCMNEALGALNAASLVTHLALRAPAVDGPLAERLPALLGLECDAGHLPTLLEAPHPTLRALVVRGATDPQVILTAIDKLPALRFIGLRCGARFGEFVEQLWLHPASTQLWGLDLFAPDVGAHLDALLSHPDRCRALTYLGLPAGVVDPEAQTRLEGLGAPVFVSPDRREVLALDFETHGWGHGAA